MNYDQYENNKKCIFKISFLLMCDFIIKLLNNMIIIIMFWINDDNIKSFRLVTFCRNEFKYIFKCSFMRNEENHNVIDENENINIEM